MNYFSIPLTTSPDQSFRTKANIRGKNITCGFRVRYNTEGNYWTISMYTDNYDQNLIDDIVVYAGYTYYNDLLKQYRYKQLGSLYVLPKKMNTSDYPDMNNINSDYYLIWGDSLD